MRVIAHIKAETNLTSVCNVPVTALRSNLGAYDIKLTNTDPAYPDPNDNESGYQGPLQCGGAPKSNVISVSYGQIEVS